MIEEDVEDLVSRSSRFKQQNPHLFSKEVKKDRIAIRIAQQIITERVNNQIAFNIIDLKDLKEISKAFATR